MKDAPGDGRPYLWRNEIDPRIDADAAVVIRNYRMALQRDPSLDKARLGLADKLREQQRSDEAEVEYDLYIKRNTKNVDGHVGAGQTSLQKGDVAAAVRHFNDALAIDPRDAVALRELALIDLRNGRYTQARDRLKTVIEVDPYDPEIHSSYARALKMSGDAAKALEENATTERLRKEHRRMNELRVKLVERPDDLALRNEAARWLLEHGHEAEGLEWTKLILSKQADHPETNALLAEYYRKRGNVGLANYYKMAAAKAGAMVP
jgi:tetratricopeptide (TPR) repeat protein